MLKSMFFGVVIVDLNGKQIKELKRIYEAPILAKLRLSKTFPKALLYTRKSFLGVGLIALEIAIMMEKIKVYLGYKRVYHNFTNILKIGEEIVESLSRITK